MKSFLAPFKICKWFWLFGNRNRPIALLDKLLVGVKSFGIDKAKNLYIEYDEKRHNQIIVIDIL